MISDFLIVIDFALISAPSVKLLRDFLKTYLFGTVSAITSSIDGQAYADSLMLTQIVIIRSPNVVKVILGAQSMSKRVSEMHYKGAKKW